MLIWVLGLKGSRKDYIIYYDLFENGVIKQNQQAELYKLDIIRKTAETSNGDFNIIDNYKEFLGL